MMANKTVNTTLFIVTTIHLFV